LSNPLQSTKLRFSCAALVFVVALGIYLRTLAPTVTFVDSGELIVAARYLGVAHPPGFPLYVLLAHLATLLPVGDVAVRVNLASALFAALAAAVLTLVLAEILSGSYRIPDIDRSRNRSGSRKGRRSTGDDGTNGRGNARQFLIAFIPAFVSGLLLIFSRTLWSFATIAEVYTLNTLLVLVVFLLLLRWRRTILKAQKFYSPVRRTKSRFGQQVASDLLPDGQNNHRFLYAAAFVFGVGLGVHHVTVGVTLPALALLVYRSEGWEFYKSRRLLYAALIALAGLFMVYSYLPLSASRSPVMNWGDPRTLQRIWWHISGRQYQVFLSFSLEQMINQLWAFSALAANEFGPWWLPFGLILAAVGFVDSFRRDKTIFYFLALLVIGDLAYALNYEIAEDKGAYYLPTFVSLAIAAGLGARCILAHVHERTKARYIAAAVLTAFLPPAAAVAGNYSLSDHSRYFLARDYVNNIESTIAPHGMLLTTDWQVYSPLLYVSEIERQRPDIIAIDLNMLRRSWYFDYLKRAYPDLLEQTRDKVASFLEDLKAWEQDPEAFDRSGQLTQRIDTHFREMIIAFIATHMQMSRVYITNEVALDHNGPYRELTKQINASYQLVPQGLVFQLSLDRSFADLSELSPQTRGLFDGTLKFEPDDVVALKVKPVYLNMLLNRGRYLAAYGHHERAIEAFKQVLVLDPALEPAREGLSASLSSRRTNR
jgi:tetratricopeptide (TPR) repeat protein